MLDKKYFSESDILRVRKLLSIINSQAKFERSLSEFVELYNELDWVSKTIIPKMEGHLVDDIKIKHKDAEKAE